MKQLSIRGARQHNLRNVNLDLPRDQITVITGLSGSGKSSLAFDTLYAEGQRRYIESLSTYARQFLEQMEKPEVDSIEGLSPAISIEQKTTSRNVRSTVGTITEIYDYLRLLFSSIGTPHCPQCDRVISRQSVDQIVERVQEIAQGGRCLILAPVVRDRKGEFKKFFEQYAKQGFIRARVDGSMIELEDPPQLDKRKNHTLEIVVDRLVVSAEIRMRLENSVRQAIQMAEGLVTVSVVGGPEILVSESMACVDCGVSVPTLEPRSFSFNSKYGSCPVCEGLGVQLGVSLERLVQNPKASVDDLTLQLVDRDLLNLFRESSRALLKEFSLSPRLSFAKFPSRVLDALRGGLVRPIRYQYGGFSYDAIFRGLDHWFKDRIEATGSNKKREQLLSFMAERDCPVCEGNRLRPESLSVKINGRSISAYCRIPLDDCFEALGQINLSSRERAIASQIVEEIQHRIRFLLEVGLSYLTLDRKAVSLSGGEAQRVRLATQVGSRLRGVLYVLDEPSVGLHPRDVQSLLGTLRKLRDLGNTIVVVEHDEDTIRSGDYLVDLGPGAASEGGAVVAQGNLSEVLESGDSLTAAYLRGSRVIETPERRRSSNSKRIELLGVQHNNLRSIDVAFPLGLFTAVTGVSGSGKSSLVDEVLFRALSRELYGSLLEPGVHREISGLEHIDKVIEIDQSPIGRTPRSNPATYTGLFTPIRELFALLPESRARGYKPGRFSFNVRGGRCEVCQGNGLRKIEMNFLPDVYVLCETCDGTRYNRETRAIKYGSHSISDVLGMTVEESYPLLENFPPMRDRLRTLLEVGLGYIRLGQSATTLSGGEAQRVKLASELNRRSTGKTLYILDEPTTGLHFEDVSRLLKILSELVNLGNTVIVIEHNLEVVKCADWVIDLGPGGGNQGGRVVAQGRPEEIADCEGSFTGQALRKILYRSSAA